MGLHLWMGVGLSIAFLQIWHLALPIDWRATAAVFALGAAGWVCRIARARKSPTSPERPFQPLTPRQRIIFIALSTLIVLWTLNRCLRQPLFYDAGLYYFQSIRWLNEYPVVPGLGNLDGRLAFNQSYFLFPAFLNAAPYFNKGYHLANGFLLATLAVQLLHRALQPAVLSLRICSAVMLVVVLKQVDRESLSSPMPDVAILVLGVVLTHWLVEFLIEARESPGELAASIAHIVALSVLGITFKLSFLAFGVVTIVLVTYLSFRTAVDASLNRLSAVVSAVFLALLLGVPWLVRGVIASGYPAYPSHIATWN